MERSKNGTAFNLLIFNYLNPFLGIPLVPKMERQRVFFVFRRSKNGTSGTSKDGFK